MSGLSAACLFLLWNRNRRTAGRWPRWNSGFQKRLRIVSMMIGYLLSYGQEVRILSPPKARDTLREMAEAVVNAHRDLQPAE